MSIEIFEEGKREQQRIIEHNLKKNPKGCKYTHYEHKRTLCKCCYPKTCGEQE